MMNNVICQSLNHGFTLPGQLHTFMQSCILSTNIYWEPILCYTPSWVHQFTKQGHTHTQTHKHTLKQTKPTHFHGACIQAAG